MEPAGTGIGAEHKCWLSENRAGLGTLAGRCVAEMSESMRELAWRVPWRP